MSSNLSSGQDTSITNGSNGSSTPRSVYDDARGGKRTSASLRNELTNLKSDLDSLLSHAASLTDKELSEAHTKLLAKFSSVRYAARGMAAEAGKQINQGVEITTGYVKDKPLQSVAIATGVGLLLGMILRRR